MTRYILLLIMLVASVVAYTQQSCPIIPIPQFYNQGVGNFILKKNTSIRTVDPSLEPMAYFLQKEFLKRKGISLCIQPKSESPQIVLLIENDKTPKNGAYSLKVDPNNVIISSATDEGILYGIMSLFQLINETNNGTSLQIPVCEIRDVPRYSWRGFMLDESRHFFGKEKVKSILDWMAFYKLNRFHWHLTDEPGWRIEIKKYPKLTLIGGIGEFKNPNKPAQYYTQEDIKEIVAYATERFIKVIPEIDMPGHAAAANRAYPEFNGGGTPPNYPDFTFNPGKEETYQFLTNILREIDALFPSQMIHLGGDEVQYGNSSWQTNEFVTDLKTKKHLKDLKAVEYYFIQRMADSIASLNNRVLAWDEIIDASLSCQPIIFWWRQDKIIQLKKAMDMGYETVLCPRLPLYFDFVQDSTHQVGRRWKGAYNSLQKLYSFSHEQFAETHDKGNLILGIQANLWTETVETPQRLEYLMFPRLAALAEAAWTESSRKDFKEFEIRLKKHLILYKMDGIYYYDPFESNKNPEAVR